MQKASETEIDTRIATATSIEEYFAFAGRGRAEQIDALDVTGLHMVRHRNRIQRVLGPWQSTAICGNDITSSVLYVSALCATQAGMWAPLVLLLVGAVLYLYRKIYAEVGSALPLNGGTYTLLLNSTNKRLAAAAAVLTLLSYAATAVISAAEAMEYAQHLLAGLNVYWATLGLLGGFAALNILGLRDSAKVALVIFLLHIATLCALSLAGIVKVIANPGTFHMNWALPSTTGLGHALFFGFAAALLGISGFESSANFIEEQKHGVFPITLRNMWMAVIVFNPLISLLSLGLLPLADIQTAPADMLARMGEQTLGTTFGNWVSIDAVLVLSGAVLTSYVGVTGLVRRMTLDQCLPQVLLRVNRWRNTNHWIILGFCLLCASILEVTQGDLASLGGVYTLAFLSVMALYAIGNMLLKARRSRLPRTTRAGWPTVLAALAAVMLGLLGNVLLSPHDVGVFLAYYSVGLLVIGTVFMRVQLLKVLLFASRSVLQKTRWQHLQIGHFIMRAIDSISRRPVVYFVSDDDAAALNEAVLYVLSNEQTRQLKIVHVFEHESDIPAKLREHVEFIDRLYLALRIDFVCVKGTFGPLLVEALARRWGISKNMMFMGTPGRAFPHRIEILGGVRVVV